MLWTMRMLLWSCALVFGFGEGSATRGDGFVGYRNPSAARKLYKKTSKIKVERLGQLLKKNVQRLRNTLNGEVELVFLVDSSASVGQDNFFDELKFVKKLLADFTVDMNKTRVSVITFSSQSRVVRHVDHLTLPSPLNHKCSLLEEELPRISYTGGATYTLGAVKEAQKVFQSARPGALKAVFLMTDGYSNAGDPRPAAEELRDDGVKVFTFGIRNGNVRELRDMASEPKDEHSFILNSFEEFEALARRALHEDLKTGSFLQVDQRKCNGLCEARRRCCDTNASCRCGTHTGHYECMCNPGYQGTGLQGQCHPCPRNTFKNDTTSEECVKCPDRHHYSPKGSTSIYNCTCRKGFTTEFDGSCSTLRCSDLKPPENGYFVKGSCETAFNAACGVRCQPGYQLIGSSLRLCNLDGTWSGTEAKCKVKKCPKLEDPENGSMLCTRDDASFQTKCHFTCNHGYSLLGSSTRTCMAIAHWDGIGARCKEVKCRSLEKLKDGSVFPDICTKDRPKYGTTCHYNCKKGFKLVGPLSRSCLGDGLWSYADRKSVCLDVTSPAIKCPNDVITVADDGESTAHVDWEIPEAADNSQRAPSVRVIPAVLPPKMFPIGETKIKYIAEDGSRNQGFCVFSITVKDLEAPIVDSCISPEPLVVKEPFANVTWEEPIFSDNSGQDLAVSRTHGRGMFPQGVTDVIYTAVDPSENNNTCTIKVDVREHPCAIPSPPLNGDVKCSSSEDYGVNCTISCLQGFDFAFENPVEYFCANDGIWKPHRMPFPDCSPVNPPNDVTQSTNAVFNTGKSCDDRLSIARAATSFQRQVSNKIADTCGDNVVCTVANFATSCVEDKNENNFLNALPSLRIKRDVTSKNDKDVQKGKSERPSPSTNETKLEFNFKIQGTAFAIDKKNTSHEKILLEAMDRVKVTLTKLAEVGELDQKFGGETVLDLEEINFFPEEPVFICPPGSIVRHNACIRCPVGTYFNVITEACESCDKGRYQPVDGQLSCLVCPNNRTTSGNNSKSVGECKAQCLPGTISHDGLEMCQSCEMGFYQPDYAKRSCFPCPQNTTTWRRGTRKVEDCGVMCPAGLVSRTGLQPCFPCPRGYFQPDPGRSSCFRCPEKSPTLHPGSTSITDCKGLIEADRPNKLSAELLINECFAEPCRNGGRCQGLSVGYICECPPGYSGLNCEFEIDECVAVPCHNNATCIDKINAFDCICPAGYNGSLCQLELNECDSSPCQHGGTCTDQVNGYDCKCSAGYAGGNCEINIDDCASQPCHNNATCVDKVLGFDCTCAPGFQGVTCEEDIDDCERSPCLNGATCHDQVNGFTCECLPGFLGLGCEIDINECDSNPCQNGGTCLNEVNKFTCVCAPSYTGVFCQTELSSAFRLQFENSGTIDHTVAGGIPNMTSVTVAFWMQSSDRSTYGTPFSYAANHEWDNALTLLDYSGFVFYINGEKVITDIAVNDGQWHHVITTWSSEEGRWVIYVDGEKKDDGEGLAQGTTIPGGGRLVLGQEQDIYGGGFSAAESFVGNLSMLNVWDHVITSHQIQRLVTTCERYIGNVRAWPDFLAGIHGRVKRVNSTFCSDCPKPPKIDNGDVALTGLSISDTATYTCYHGYEIVGSARRVCQIYGHWDEKEPRCERVRCGWPGRLKNGQVRGNYKFEGVVTHTCYENYRLKGNKTRECTADGTWSGKAPECVEITCPSPQPSKLWLLSGGSEVYRPEHIVEFACHSDYNLIGNDTITCGSDGTWDHPFPVCVPEGCGEPPVIANGAPIESADISDDEKYVEYACVRGYKMAAGHRIKCLPDGNWEDFRPTCVPIYCNEPAEVLHGSYSGGNLTVGDALHFACDHGFRLNGAEVIRCNETGEWNDTVPSCNQIKCPSLSHPKHGAIEVENRLVGTFATYACDEGFELRGDQRRVCLETGAWDEESPECDIVNCGLPDQVENGSTSGDNFEFGSTVTYRCIRNHVLIGETERTCLADGKWSGEVPSCLLVECPKPKPLGNGFVMFSGRTFNDTAEYGCDKGYSITGQNLLRCQLDSTWNGTIPKCVKKECIEPVNITGGYYLLQGLTPGSKVEFRCSSEYKLVGNATLVCQADFEWSSTPPQCVKRSCKLGNELTNGYIEISDQEDTSILKYSCRDGYRLVGDEIRECVNGLWTGKLPRCSFGCSAPPDVLYAYALADSYGQFAVGDTAEYVCDLGYRHESHAEITCQANLTWSVLPSCQPVSCDAPQKDIAHTVVAGNNFTYGAAVDYICEDGYYIDGPSRRLCGADGKWDIPEPTCKPVHCRLPGKLHHGWVSGAEFTFETEITHLCLRGFNLVGNVKRKCLSNGTWSGDEPHCELISCPKLQPIAGGRVVISGKGIEAVAEYSCDERYQISKANTRRCRDTGRWTGYAPICQRVNCNYPPFLEHGSIFHNETTYESVALLDCNPGYILEGVPVITCQGDGSWSKILAKCHKKNCTEPDEIPNGVTSFDSLAFGSEASIKCDYGFQLIGDEVRVCQANGSWSGSKPQCTEIMCGSPEEIPDGSIATSPPYTVDSVVEYNCDNGYRLEGASVLVCQENAHWSDGPPTCSRIECPPIGQIRDGQTVGTTRFVNDSYEFECNAGYELNGPPSVVCNMEGVWSDDTPSCEIIRCQNLKKLTNGKTYRNKDDNTFGTVVRYVCDHGHEILGPLEITCLANKTWSSKQPTCERLSCLPLPLTIGDGVVNISGHQYGDRATFKCNPGHSLVGEEELFCEADGSWTSNVPFCYRKTCPELPDLAEGKVEAESHSYESVATHACDYGFRLRGEKYLHCNEHGEWNASSPSCVKIVCPRPGVLVFGKVKITGVHLGDIARFSCHVGYTIQGSPLRRCLENNTWSGTLPKCEIVTCPFPDILDNGKIKEPKKLYKFSDTLTDVCDDGYELRVTEAQKRACLADGTWSKPSISCEMIRCPKGVAPNGGKIEIEANVYGGILKYACKVGYEINGSRYRICLGNKTWSGTPPSCNKVKCPVLKPIEFGRLSSDNREYKDVVKYTCEPGHRLAGKEETMCLASGTWSNKPPFCERITCPPPDNIPGGHMRGDNYYFNMTVEYDCIEGHRLVGNKIRYCQENSAWSGYTPSCDAIMCPKSPVPENGFIVSNGQKYGSIIKYNCADGYKLSGDAIRKCEGNGTWTGESPECVKIACPKLSDFQNGYIVGAENSVGSVAVYHCFEGHRLEGSVERKCRLDGTWSAVEPTCSIVHCPQPPPLENGEIFGENYAYGSKLLFRCREGFERVGAEYVTCTGLKTWSDAIPECLKVQCHERGYLENGFVIGGERDIGALIEYRCREGYVLVGEPFSMCRRDGKWSGDLPECQSVVCDEPPRIPHAMGMPITDEHGRTNAIYYKCENGFEIEGNDIILCEPPNWLGDLPECKKAACPAPPWVSNASSIMMGQTEVEYICDQGFQIVGKPILKCLENGTWETEGAPYCDIIDCGVLPLADEYILISDNETTFESTIFFNCTPGYRLNGESNATCLSSGSWSGATPRCEPLSCGEPSPILNGQVQGEANTFGATMYYSCDVGFRLVGDPSRRCSETGRWTEEDRHCERIICPKTAAPKDGSVLMESTSYGEVIYYKCDKGFQMEGNDTATCLANGTWSTRAPKCRGARCPKLPLIPNTVAIMYGEFFVGDTVTLACKKGFKPTGSMSYTCLSEKEWSPFRGSCERISCGQPAMSPGVQLILGRSFLYKDRVVYVCRPGLRPEGNAILRCLKSGQWSGKPKCNAHCRYPCKNGGMCVALNKCACPNGYSGPRCEVATCILPCLNGGTCVGPYWCQCRQGYKGSRCQTVVCAKPCANNGYCMTPNRCLCPRGYKQPFCEEVIPGMRLR